MTMAYDAVDADLDLVWGAAAIAKEIKRNKRVTYWLLENGTIPAKNAGKQWVISRRKLREAFGLEKEVASVMTSITAARPACGVDAVSEPREVRLAGELDNFLNKRTPPPYAIPHSRRRCLGETVAQAGRSRLPQETVAAMSALLDPRAADKLVRICGMFGSNHDGERASAAAMADKLIRSQGLTWPEVISSSWTNSSSTAGKIAFALAHLAALSMWERGFIYSVNGKRDLSPNQLEILDEIVAKARAFAEVQS